MQYRRFYTLRDKSGTLAIFREEMNVLGIKDSDVFQIQLEEYKNEKQSSKENSRRR